MKRGWRAILIVMSVVIIVGCAGKEKAKPKLVQDTGVNEEKNKYNPYLLRMTDDERARFFRLETDHQRDQFLRAEGITDKKFLHDNLQLGMSKPQAREKLGPPNSAIVDFDDQGRETRWLFKRFNGTRFTHYALVFRNEKLESWDVWVKD